MTERDYSPFDHDKELARVSLGTTFVPFEDSYYTVSDGNLPEPDDPMGYSPTFVLEGYGRGRFELFEAPESAIPADAERFAGNEEIAKFAGYDIVPTRVIPRIYRSDPDVSYDDLTCLIRVNGSVFRSDSQANSSLNERISFDKWSMVGTNLPAGNLDVFTLDTLQALNVRFERTKDVVYTENGSNYTI